MSFDWESHAKLGSSQETPPPETLQARKNTAKRPRKEQLFGNRRREKMSAGRRETPQNPPCQDAVLFSNSLMSGEWPLALLAAAGAHLPSFSRTFGRMLVI